MGQINYSILTNKELEELISASQEKYNEAKNIISTQYSIMKEYAAQYDEAKKVLNKRNGKNSDGQ